MSVPELVRERLGDESPLASVPLGGDDALVVTPSRTLIYRAEGLLSGESIEEHPHDAERVVVSDGRRKSTIRLDRGIEGDSEFTVPSSRLEELLTPLLTGVFATTGAIDPDEAVRQVYRQGELTLVITDRRVLKHIGGALWDPEHEEYRFEDVTRLDLEAGEVSSQVIVEANGRPERIKVPSEEARLIRQRIEEALLEYHEVGSYAAFREQVAPEPEPGSGEEAGDTEATDEASEDTPDFGGIATIGEPDVDAGSAGAATEPADTDEPDEDGGEGTELEFGPPQAERGREADGDRSVEAELAELRAAVERHNELLEEHHETLERLIEELRRGR